MSESYYFYVAIPAGTDALWLAGDPIYGVWAGGKAREDIPLQRVELHDHWIPAEEEAARLSFDPPYLIEVVTVEFRAGRFSFDDAPRECLTLYYLGDRYGIEEDCDE